jgi:tRNA threonylcarbamoyladenosine biosynthesis protein TsaE
MGGETLAVLELQSQSEAETIRWGRQIGERLVPGDLILLLAPFGAGKTHFAKGIAAGLGADPDEVNSPSFVLINEYAAGPRHSRMPIYHADLYRIESAHDLATVGLEDCIDGDGVCVIEWAERAASLLSRDRLVVQIAETGESSRCLRLIPYGSRYEHLVADVARSVDSSQTSQIRAVSDAAGD